MRLGWFAAVLSTVVVLVAPPQSTAADHSPNPQYYSCLDDWPPYYPRHEPIRIVGDSNFTQANGVSAGDGTAANPYAIQEWKINARSHGIDVANTTAHFVIRNVVVCWGRNLRTGNDGIRLTNVTNGQVEMATLRCNLVGIRVTDSSRIRISGFWVPGQMYPCHEPWMEYIEKAVVVRNTTELRVADAYIGDGYMLLGFGLSLVSNVLIERINFAGFEETTMTLDQCRNVTMAQISYGGGKGITIRRSSNVTVQEHTATMVEGIEFFSSTDIIVERSYVENSGAGIWAEDSTDILVMGNTFAESGAGVTASRSARIRIVDNAFSVIAATRLTNCRDASVFHNRYLRPGPYQVGDTGGPENAWDDGYPSGGNFWSDYTGEDLYSGTNQDLPGSDGIGDVPYVIDDDTRDRYPLLPPLEIAPGEPIRHSREVPVPAESESPSRRPPGWFDPRPPDAQSSTPTPFGHGTPPSRKMSAEGDPGPKGGRLEDHPPGPQWRECLADWPPYYSFHEPIRIEGDGDFTKEDGVSAGNGTAANPYVIQEWKIDATSHGIDVANTTAYFVIRNVVVCWGRNLMTGYDGIRLVNVTNGRIEEAGLVCNLAGIRILDSSKIQVSDIYHPGQSFPCRDPLMEPVEKTIVVRNATDMTISHTSSYGPVLAGLDLSLVSNSLIEDVAVSPEVSTALRIAQSRNVTVRNLVGWSAYAAILQSSSIIVDGLSANITNGINVAYSTRVTIRDSTAGLASSGYGVYPQFSTDVLIEDNTFYGTSRGIMALSTSGLRIKNNSISAPLWLADCTNATVFHNRFLQPGPYQVRDTGGSENAWDDGYPSGGNFWSDYTGEDLYSGTNQDLPGSDGIGDVPYVIDDDTRDRYPLLPPLEIAPGEPIRHSREVPVPAESESPSRRPPGWFDPRPPDAQSSTPTPFGRRTPQSREMRAEDDQRLKGDSLLNAAHGVPPPRKN